MNWIALKMLTADRARYLAILAGVIAQLLAWQAQHERIGAVVVSGEPATTRLETE